MTHQEVKNTLNIIILSRKPALYSTRRLVEAGVARGHHMRVVNTLRCYMNITADKPTIHYQGEELNNTDAIIPRIGASITFYGAAVVRQFEMMSVFTPNPSVSITRSRDKLRSLQLLSKKGVGLPTTGFSNSTGDTQDLIDLVGGPPLIIKVLEGTQGRGVILVETKQAAENVIDALTDLKQNILVQKFITEADGADIRCFVVGNKVIASMIRKAKPGEFRSNLHRGGTAAEMKITAEERRMAIKAAKIMGLNIAGVDLIRTKDGPVIIEVNSSPGLEGIESCTGVDVAGHIIDYIVENANKPRKPTPQNA